MPTTTPTNWYEPADPDAIASPALLIYPERIKANIETLIEIAGDVQRLRPHVKTHKLPQVVKLHSEYGIHKLKCATIAEAEMVAECGVPDILLAYQPVGPNQQRLINLAQAFPGSQFGCLIDNEKTLRQMMAKVNSAEINLNIWIDLDNGNGRTGIKLGKSAEQLAKQIADAPNLTFAGLHVYDGQFAGLAIEQRIEQADNAFEAVDSMITNLANDGLDVPNVVVGGSPSFPVHALRSQVDLSPGTYSLWDAGYATICPELPFIHAGIVITRVISKPADNRICLDLGTKSIAPENPINKRVRLFAAQDVQYIKQNEEHLVIELSNADEFDVGDTLYGIPWHICPTVALHQEANAIDANGAHLGRWPIAARGRRLTY
ncbi:MAG: D-TA family PLP-dependent enzyme [Candidatus Promineifilaceae bacterium]